MSLPAEGQNGNADHMKVAIAAGIVFLIFYGSICYDAGNRHGKDTIVRTFKNISPDLVLVSTRTAADFSSFEKSKFEIVRVVFNDGAWFQQTSLELAKVYLTPEKLDGIIKAVFRREMSDVKMIIHNHLRQKDFPENYKDARPEEFSDGDMDTYVKLQRLGFAGEWCIWVDGRIIKYEN